MIDSFTIVADEGGLAVDGNRSADNPASIGIADALVTQAHAEDRDPAAKTAQHIVRDPRLQRGAGSGGDNNVAGTQLLDVGGANPVVAKHERLPTQLSDILGEVINKGVVVINYQNHLAVTATFDASFKA